MVHDRKRVIVLTFLVQRRVGSYKLGKTCLASVMNLCSGKIWLLECAGVLSYLP